MTYTKNRAVLCIAAVICILLFPGCGIFSFLRKGPREKAEEPRPPEPVSKPVPVQPSPEIPSPVSETKRDVMLRIGEREITRDEFEKRYTNHLLAGAAEKEEVLTRKEFLDKIIVDELLWNYAEYEGIEKDPAFLALLDNAKERLLTEYIIQNKLLEKITLSDEEIRWYYSEKLEDFIQPSRIQVRHILTSTMEEAKGSLDRLKAGESFGDVAREMSIHASRDQGGQLPPFSRGTYNRDFEEAAFSLEVGERSPIVVTDLGYHIIEKTGETPQTAVPFDEVKDEIGERILKEKKKRVLEAFYKKLRSETRVEVLSEP